MRKAAPLAAVLAGNQLARWSAVAVLGLNTIDQMFFIPARPFWSLTIMAVDAIAPYGLCAYGSRALTWKPPSNGVGGPRLGPGMRYGSDRGGSRKAGRGRSAVMVARAARAARGLWPDRNPLRRTLDRFEAAVVAGLVVALLAGGPLAGLATGHAVYRIWSRTADAEQAAWRQVPAVLLAAPDDGQVLARWAAPDGTRHTGTVPAPPGAKAGRTVAVWVDAGGRQTGPPVWLWQVRSQAALAAVLACFAVGLVVLCAGLLAHNLVGRRRLAAWDADWRATEPQWTGRH